MLKNVECNVKFDVEKDHFQRSIYFQRKKYDVKKLNILRVVPVTTLLDRTAVFLPFFTPPVAVLFFKHNSGSYGLTWGLDTWCKRVGRPNVACIVT